MKVNRPDSTCGRKASCWLLLKRCTSSTKTTVARPVVARRLRPLDRFADVLDAAEHRRHGDELGVERVGHEARQRRLAGAGRAPQDHRVQPPRLEGDAQGLARAEQVRAGRYLVERLRPQRSASGTAAASAKPSSSEVWATCQRGREGGPILPRRRRRRGAGHKMRPLPSSPRMQPSTFAAISSVLVEQLPGRRRVDPAAGGARPARPRFACADRVRVRGRGPLRRPDPRGSARPSAGGHHARAACDLARRGARREGARRCRQRLARRAGSPSRSPAAGVVSPIGVGVRAFGDALFAGRSGGPRPRRRPARDRASRRFRSRPPTSTPPSGVAPSRLPLDRATAMALVSADEAARRAGLVAGGVDRERLGIFWGSGMGGASTFEATCRTVYADRRRMRPTSVVTTMPNAPAAELAFASARAVPLSPTHALARHPRSRSARPCVRFARAGSTSPSPAAASRC